ncbi:MAG TPA: ABC transporter substrate-binding protein [Gemmatimonadales bacterium]|nr:ABC transporter substrate-binding protein [Gemmatimonadales bacterium]
MTRARNRRITLLAAMLAVMALAACGSVAARRGATVMFASGADLQSINPLLTLHPLAHQVQRYVLFTTLVRYDSAMQVQPYLARSWHWSRDHRRLTFILHANVRWHDGTPTTARDAAWTLNAARDSVTGYPRYQDVRGIQHVSAEDDSTLVIQFGEPQSRIPDVLTDLAVLPEHILRSVPHGELRRSSFNEHPVGNGPFRFVSHEPNRRWVFQRNDDFPASLGGPPRLDRFIVVVVDEPATKLAALSSGELDFAGIQPAHADFVRRDPHLAVVTYPLLFTYGIVFNTRHPPFDQVEVRRAVSDALDRQEIVDGYLFGFGTPAVGPVPEGVPGRLDDGRESRVSSHELPRPATRDPRLSFQLLTVGSGEAALEQLVQAQLARAGFGVHIRQMELSAFLDRVYGASHDFDAAVLGVPGDPGLGYLAPLLQLAGLPADGNTDAEQRSFHDQVPVAFLYHARGLQGMNRRVHHVVMDLRGELPTVAQWSVE